MPTAHTSRAGSRIAALLFIIAGGCGPGQRVTTGGGVIERQDSAGITIVTVPGTLLDSLPPWTLGPPSTTLGGGDSVNNLMWVAGGGRLDDDEIVVADGRSKQLRIFDTAGTFLRAYGRNGQGPGEYLSIAKASSLVGDWIAIYDVPLSRVTRLNLRTGEAISRQIDRTFCDGRQYPEEKWSCNIEALLPNGDWLVRRDGIRSFGMDPRPQTVYPSVPRFIHVAIGSTLRAIDSGISDENVRVIGPQHSFFAASTLFSPESQVVAGDTLIAFGTPNRFEIRTYSVNGTPRLIIRVAKDATPVTSQMLQPIRAWADSTKTGSPEAKEYVRGYSPKGDVPFFGEIRLDRAGRIWARDYYPPGSLAGVPADYQWTVFGADGTPEARVAIRAKGDILELGRDYALLLEQDADGVETVVLRKFAR